VILINLLPHREAARQRRKVAFFVSLGLSAAVGVTLSILWFAVTEGMIVTQRDRNAYLQGEISRLDSQIKDIATLRSEIDALRARQKAVEDLQLDRNLPVHVLNELARQTPEGVYFTSVRQEGGKVMVSGMAQSNDRVTEFLRNTGNTSEWLTKPELIVVQASSANSKDSRRLFEFQVRLDVKRPAEAEDPAKSKGKG
jgi:type IV pilus assembly protein PilN